MMLEKSLDINITYFEELFKQSGDIVKRKIPIGSSLDRFIYVIYIDMMADRATIENTILPKLMASAQRMPESFFNKPLDLFSTVVEGGMTTADLKEEQDIKNLERSILSGDTVILIDNADKAIVVATKGFPSRGVPEASIEVVVQGTSEAFSEIIRINTTLLRRRIKDTSLQIVQSMLGKRSKTDIALCYMDDIVRPKVLKEIKAKLAAINIDAVTDVGQISEILQDRISSPFPVYQITERPDKAASAILEGRIVILADNSPLALILPATFNLFFQASEDYGAGWEIMSFVRALRFMAAFLSLALPGLYIAITTFHPDMLPLSLIFHMANSRENIVFSSVAEILIMELAFELLREAGIRLPRPVGSSIGIIGGLIVGEAAVSAGIVSPIVVIVVALTGIASFAIPNYSLVSAFRLCKFLVIFLSAGLGLYGFWVAMLIIIIHLSSLKSCGLPYLFPFVSGEVNNYTDLKDTLFRLPLIFMKKRPIFANQNRNIRLANKGDKNYE